MGRSQVKYNQTHGRPGTKGRGKGGGRGRAKFAAESRSSQPQLPPGDNAWRYSEATQTSAVPSDAGANDAATEADLELLNLEARELPNSYSENVENENTSIRPQLVKGIDVGAMGMTLDKLSVAQRLGIPSYLTVDLEVKDAINSVPSKDMHGTPKAVESSLHATAGKQDSGSNDIGESQGPEKVVDEGSAGNEDDLDAWLDSVIS